MASESYQAAYDVLSIARRLEPALDGVTRAEIHLLAYVACLLTVYRRLPAAEWGYGFIRSQWGAPFSSEINNALDLLVRGGFLSLRGEVVVVSPNGHRFVNFLDGIAVHRWRAQYLDGACGSALAMPVGSIRAALHHEPSMRRARVHQQPRALLGTGEDALYEQFGSLSDVIGSGVADLMVPSVVWLTYLQEIQQLETERAAAEIRNRGDQDV